MSKRVIPLTPEQARAMHALELTRWRLNHQQYKTIRGQIIAGDTDGALRGLDTLLKRIEKNEAEKRPAAGCSDC